MDALEPLSVPLECWDYRCAVSVHGCGLNLGLHACRASILPTELHFQLRGLALQIVSHGHIRPSGLESRLGCGQPAYLWNFGSFLTASVLSSVKWEC